MCQKLPKSPWFIILDTETTDVKEGDAVEIGAIMVHRNTLEVLGHFHAYIPKSPSAVMNEAGRKHYEKVKSKCEVAPPLEYTVKAFTTWARGSEEYAPPTVMGYCVRRVDLPIIRRQFNLPQDHWLRDEKNVFDVAFDLVFKIYPKTDEKRRLVDIARTLGIKVDSTRAHTPVYDCMLTLEVMKEINYLQDHNLKIPEFSKSAYVNPFPSGPTSKETLEEAAKRYKDPKYRYIRCPHCKQPTMQMWITKNHPVPEKLDDYFYACENKGCKFTMSIDGTKGHRGEKDFRIICNIEDLIIKES